MPNRLRIAGSVEPKTEALTIEQVSASPTHIPNAMLFFHPATTAVTVAPQDSAMMAHTTRSLRISLTRLSLSMCPTAMPRIMIMADWVPTLPLMPVITGTNIKRMTASVKTTSAALRI